MSDAVRLPGVALCIALLSYDGAQDAIEAAMPEHVAWLNRAYAGGMVLLSGRRTPWTGGVLLCRGDEDRVSAFVATSPWVAQGLATAEIVGFAAGLASAALGDAFL